MQRAIVGFHTDSDGHWVAELSCGHGQHVRHQPPWTVRAWVTTDAGRASRLGAELECRACGTIRPFVPRDRAPCLALFRGEAAHFTARDEACFVAFVSAPSGSFFVVEDDAGRLLAAGGLTVDASEPSLGWLGWDIVERERRGQGIGRALIEHSLRTAPASVRRVRVATTLAAQGFYEKLGFQRVSTPRSEDARPWLERPLP